jgi:hypothetical protein
MRLAMHDIVNGILQRRRYENQRKETLHPQSFMMSIAL